MSAERTSALPANLDELLERFKPQPKYDSQEAFFADSCAEMTINPGNELRRAPHDGMPGALIAAVGSGTQPLTLGLLRAQTYTNGEAAEKSDRLGIEGTDYRSQYVRLRIAHPELRNKIYGHAAVDSGGRIWLQYWFWYFYNDYHLAADFGLHEGDWEMIQLRLQGEQPDLAVYAQHRQAEKRSWADVKRAPGTTNTPLVFPGRGSHASYFEPGLYETEAWYDVADGKRKTPELELVPVHDAEPPWVAWPGQWGDTEPGLLPGLEQPSPHGPSQHDQWKDPSVLLATALTRTPETPSSPPEVEVTRSGGHLQVKYDLSRHADGIPTKVIVTVNSVDEKGIPPRTFTFPVEDTLSGQLLTSIDLRPERHYDVYVSLASTVGGKTTSSASRLIQLDPTGTGGVVGQLPTAAIGLAVGRAIAWIKRAWRRVSGGRGT